MLSPADREIIRKARELVRTITAEDLSLLQSGQRSEYTKRRVKKSGAFSSSPKPKGGSPPIDYTAVDVLIDLQSELKQKKIRPDKVIGLYIRLRSLMGG